MNIECQNSNYILTDLQCRTFVCCCILNTVVCFYASPAPVNIHTCRSKHNRLKDRSQLIPLFSARFPLFPVINRTVRITGLASGHQYSYKTLNNHKHNKENKYETKGCHSATMVQLSPQVLHKGNTQHDCL